METNYKWIFYCKLLILKVQWSFQGLWNAAHDFQLECKFLSGFKFFLSSLKKIINEIAFGNLLSAKLAVTHCFFLWNILWGYFIIFLNLGVTSIKDFISGFPIISCTRNNATN